jgi:hypothetical protein
MRELSIVNLIMFFEVLPSYDPDDKNDKGKEEEVINADDPKNRDKVRSILFDE